MTLDDLIRRTEANLRVDKQIAIEMRNEAKNRSITEDERNAIRLCEERIEVGKGTLEQLRSQKALLDDQDAKMQITHPTGAGKSARSAEYRADGNNLFGASGSYAATERGAWIDANTGRSAVLERSQRFGEHPVVREEQARSAEQDRHVTNRFMSL